LTNIREAAYEYWKEGLNVVPLVFVRARKQPLVEWKRWQEERQTEEDFNGLPWDKADGFAVVGGGRLNDGTYIGAVDFDVKNVTPEAQSKGREILRRLRITRIERTPSGGEHWVYFSHVKPKSDSSYHNTCGLELLGEGKLIVMAPSKGYGRVNDNPPTVVEDLNNIFYEALRSAGVQLKTAQKYWFECEDLARERYTGKDPPCISGLFKGTVEGERNEYAIRLASYMLNFRRFKPESVWRVLKRWNTLNTPPLEEKELKEVLKSASQGGYVYGCKDPILSMFCRWEECPIAPRNIAKILSREEKERAEKLSEDPRFLDYVVDYGRRLLIGEDETLQCNFIVICSSRTRYPISEIITGFSGSGKNHSIRAIKLLIPPEWIFEFTTATPEAIKYLPSSFDGCLIIYEAAGIKGETGSLSLRAIGEGESIETIYPIRNERTGRMELGRAKTNARNFITTESAIDIHPDLYRRVLKHTMNHDTRLTKRVIAKKMREAQLPRSLREFLGLEKKLPFSERDFRNALRLMKWDYEVILFPPPDLTKLIDLATTKEQQVALRTQVEKIINFAKVIAIINQKRRLRLKVGENEFLIAEYEDFYRSMEILSSAIIETVQRIEKRQKEVLELFERSDKNELNKHDVAQALKISTRTAARALKTLAEAGYLKEIKKKTGPYGYELLQNTAKTLDILPNANDYSHFYIKRLKKLLKDTWTAGQRSGIKIQVWNPEKKEWTEEINNIPLTCPGGKVPSKSKPPVKHEDKVSPLALKEKTSKNMLNSELLEKTVYKILHEAGGDMGVIAFATLLKQAGFDYDRDFLQELPRLEKEGKIIKTMDTIALGPGWNVKLKEED